MLSVFQGSWAHYKNISLTETLKAEPVFNLIICEMPRWKKSHGWFPVQTTIGPSVLLVTGIHYASRKLENSCLLHL